MKNILIATNYIGFFHFLWDDIDIYNKLGYKVYAVADNSKNESHTLKIMQKKNVTFIDAKIDGKMPFTMNNIRYFQTIKRLMKQLHFDVVHCHTPIVGLLVRYAARKYRKHGTKVIYTTHGLAYTHLSSKKEYLIYHAIESFASRFCDAIITINKEDFENAKKLKCKNIYHINGVGVDTSKYKSVNIDRDEYRKKIGVATDKILILAIGELSHRKNHIVIVKALSKIKDKEKYVFAICGREMTSGGTGQEIRNLSKELGVNTLFLGFRRDIPEVIKCADIGVMPSIREGLGLSGIEMMCQGIPVVGSDVQGIKEYVINKETGYLCNPFDVKAFTDGIMSLSSKKVRKDMASNCKQIVNKFDKSISIEQRKQIYKDLLN